MEGKIEGSLTNIKMNLNRSSNLKRIRGNIFGDFDRPGRIILNIKD